MSYLPHKVDPRYQLPKEPCQALKWVVFVLCSLNIVKPNKCSELNKHKNGLILTTGQWYTPSTVINDAVYCILLHGIALYCMVLHCITWYCMEEHGIAWYCLVLHGIALYYMVLHGIALFCMVLHGIAWNCMVLHGIAWYCRVLHGFA